MGVAAVLTMWVLLPSRLQATGQGLYQVTAFGLAAIVANLAGGSCTARFGHGGPVRRRGGCSPSLAAVAGFAWFPRRGESPAGRDRGGDLEPTVPLASTTVG